jgi:ABC-2 type transport system ATP-binding protein
LSDRSTMIAAFDVSKKFGPFLAIDSADFTIPSRRVVGFLGPNGAGKTTIIRMIAGYLTPTSGRVEVAGMNVSDHRIEVRRQLGYLPESAPLYTDMRVLEFLRYRAKLHGIERHKRAAAIDLALQRCWLDDVRRRPIHQLSKGYRQRVGLAAALLHEPPILILDEPTVGLDPSQIREFRSLIGELGARHTILLSTHILPEVELTCDHVIMIARGRIRAQGSLDQVRSGATQSARYIIEVDGDGLERALRDVRGVADVEIVPLDGRWKRLIVTAGTRSTDLRESLAAAVRRANGTTRELRREAPSLEQVFVAMVEESELDRHTPTDRASMHASAHEMEDIAA